MQSAYTHSIFRTRVFYLDIHEVLLFQMLFFFHLELPNNPRLPAQIKLGVAEIFSYLNIFLRMIVVLKNLEQRINITVIIFTYVF